MSHTSSSSADNHLHHRQQQQQQQQQHRQIREVVLVEKPRHLVEDKEDLERLFPRCPPNTLESVGRQNRKSKQQQSRPEITTTTNNNNNENEVYESVEQQVLKDSAATPVANIIDLDFNSNDDQVNEQNRRYHQQLSSRGAAVSVLSPTTSDSTKSTPAKNVDKLAYEVMSTTCSSASSTASTKGSSSDERSLNKSRQNPNQGVNGARGGPKNNWTTEMDTPPTGGPPPMTALPSVGLRDTKIEIAGGREVYHQSRARSGRHKHGPKQRHSGDFSQQVAPVSPPEESVSSKRRSTGYLYENHFNEQVDKRSAKSRSANTASTVSSAPHSFIKETVFSSEIHSIEYRDSGSGVSGGILATSPGRRNLIYETDLGSTSEVVFDDIGEIIPERNSPGNCCDVNVTYDLLQGEFPPPSLGGLSVKIEEDEDLLSSQEPLGGAMSSVGQSLDNLCLGAEANYGSENTSNFTTGQEKMDHASTRVIGGITIAEYDGSPRRYRPRGSNETASNASSNSDVSKASAGGGGSSVPVAASNVSSVKAVAGNRTGRHGLRMPGFPQRVLPPPETSSSVNSSPVSVKKETSEMNVDNNQVEEEELLKFDDVPPAVPSHDVKKTTKNVTKSDVTRKNDDFDLRYEFSETRKVLEEFFQSSNEQQAIRDEDLARSNEEAERDFNELEYTLRRRSPLAHEPGGSSYVGQRLAADEGQDTLTSPCSTQSDLIGGCLMSNQDLLSMIGSGDGRMKLDQHDENRSGVGGLTGLTMMVGQTRLNVEPAPVECCDEIEGEDLHQHPSTSLPMATSTTATSGVNAIANDFTLSPEMTDCDSADLESEMSINEGSYHSSGPRMHTSMPVLEDGLSSGHASDLEDDVIYSSSGSVMLKKQQQQQPSTTPNLQNMLYGSQQKQRPTTTTTATTTITTNQGNFENGGTPKKNGTVKVNNKQSNQDVMTTSQQQQHQQQQQLMTAARRIQQHHKSSLPQSPSSRGQQGGSHQKTAAVDSGTPPTSGSSAGGDSEASAHSADPASVAAALKDIKMAIQATRVLQHQTRIPIQSSPSAQHRNNAQVSVAPAAVVSVPATPPTSVITNHHHIPDDPWVRQTSSLRTTAINSVTISNVTPVATSQSPTSVLSSSVVAESSIPNTVTGVPPVTTFTSTGTTTTSAASNQTSQDNNLSNIGNRLVEEEEEDLEDVDEENELEEEEEEEEESESEIGEERVPTPKTKEGDEDLDTDQETDRLLGQQYNDDNGYYESKNEVAKKKGTKTKEVLIEGVLFRARYLGSTQLVCEGQPTKATRMMQAEEAVSRIKALAPEGDSQPSTEVDLFISTEKIMVLNTDLKEIMMDHALRTISYIADIGDLLVIMARRRPAPTDDVQVIGTTPKMICHVFESEEAQFIAQSIGQAFQVAYVEFLKANGIEDSSFVKEMDYQEVLNSQEIFNNELALFSSKERQKEVVVPKAKGEILGVVIVESGWGSMLPTIVLANLAPGGPAARCGQLNIGDQVIAINGISLVGLPLSTCQHYIKNAKNKTAVKLTAVSCAPVVEVKIKRPDTKYQLGFSVQNGVICSLLRGGIAERGGVRVGHRIIEINGQSVVAVPHEKIVNLLATSVGEITMKTMPTSMFRLLTGQETPLYI